MSEYFNFKVNEEYNNLSIREFLNKLHVGKPKINYFITNRCFYINGENVEIDSILHLDDYLMIDIEAFEEIDYLPSEKKVEILYEDEYLLIVNKPKKIIIFPENKNETGTMANVIAGMYQLRGESHAIRHTHRLDRDTSGCLVYAKDVITHAIMSSMFENNEIKKEYLAIVENQVKKDGCITSLIGKDRHVNGKMAIVKNGKTAFTSYHVEKTYQDRTILKVKIKTGRTHQIRVHLSSIGHPLLGDYLYGAQIENVNCVMLHAEKITFLHPFHNKMMTITAPLSKEMKKYVN